MRAHQPQDSESRGDAKSRRPVRTDPTRLPAKSAQFASPRLVGRPSTSSSDSRTMLDWETLRRRASAATFARSSGGSLTEINSISGWLYHWLQLAIPIPFDARIAMAMDG